MIDICSQSSVQIFASADDQGKQKQLTDEVEGGGWVRLHNYLSSYLKNPRGLYLKSVVPWGSIWCVFAAQGTAGQPLRCQECREFQHCACSRHNASVVNVMYVSWRKYQVCVMA